MSTEGLGASCMKLRFQPCAFWRQLCFRVHRAASSCRSAAAGEPLPLLGCKEPSPASCRSAAADQLSMPGCKDHKAEVSAARLALSCCDCAVVGQRCLANCIRQADRMPLLGRREMLPFGCNLLHSRVRCCCMHSLPLQTSPNSRRKDVLYMTCERRPGSGLARAAHRQVPNYREHRITKLAEMVADAVRFNGKQAYLRA